MHKPDEGLFDNGQWMYKLVRLQVDPAQYFEGPLSSIHLKQFFAEISFLVKFSSTFDTFVQASTGFHLVYIAASTLIDIKGRIGRRNSSNESLQSSERCWYEPILLFLLHLAAVIVSCMNFVVEQVSGFLRKCFF